VKHHVSKRFDDGTVAVDNFELTVESHHLVVLLGSSGCGKTTLLRMVTVGEQSARLHDVSDLAAQLDRIDGGDISVVDEYSSFRWINHPIDQGRTT
jgi:osmoprotectant transport system ATP-binding protein